MSRTKKSWEFEIDGALEDVAATPALSKVNALLCYRCEVVLSSGDFFVCWRERDPRVPDPENFFSRTAIGRGEERINEYKKLEKKHPSKSYARKITSRDAYEIIARFWLPEEFHEEAGVGTVKSIVHQPRAVMPSKLLNARQLADKMGQNRGYVSAMKAAGFTFEYGTRTTLASALRWRRQNKQFRTTGYYRLHRGKTSAR